MGIQMVQPGVTDNIVALIINASTSTVERMDKSIIESAIEFLLQNPVINILFAVLSIYMLVWHLQRGHSHGTASTMGLIGLALYNVIHGLTHIVPALQAFVIVGNSTGIVTIAIILVVVSILCIVLSRYHKKKEEEKAASFSVQSVAGFNLVHTGFHLYVAVRGLVGAVTRVQEFGPGVIGAILNVASHPITNMAIFFISIYTIIIERRHHH